jgi:serine/threonine protein kinase
MDNIAEKFLGEYTRNLENNTPLPDPIKSEYEITACLKESNDKAIFYVRSVSDSKQYILKYNAPSCKEDLESEYSMLKSLSHPGLPGAVQYIKNRDGSYLVREYVNGSSLADHIGKRGALPAYACIKIMLQLCDILDYLHTQNPPVIHRDIKPQNIIITPEGECKLIDMGISRRYKIEETKDTVFMGTEATAAPEQFGYMQTDMRSDIYSLGVLMFYMLTGSLDIQHLEDYAILDALKSIIKKCVAFSPNDRFSSAKHLKSAIIKFSQRRPMPKFVYLIPIQALLIITAALYAVFSHFSNTPRKVVLASPLIESAVRQELGKKAEEPLYDDDLAKITKLLICGGKVYSDWEEHAMYGKDHHMNGVIYKEKGSINTLNDLAMMKNLRELAIYNQSVSDLTPLEGLEHLVHLGLGGNSIIDLSPLKGMVSIQELNIADNPVSDISVLKDMAALNELDISSTYISNISSLSGLPIQNLSLLDDNLADYSILNKLPRLEILRVRNVGSDGMNSILALAELRELTVYNSRLKDLGMFSSLTNLEMLDVFDNNIDTLKGVESLKRLRHLGIGNNKIKDLSPLIGLEGFESIDLNGDKITDYKPLLEVPSLKSIFCSVTQKQEIEKIKGNAGFEVVNIN